MPENKKRENRSVRDLSFVRKIVGKVKKSYAVAVMAVGAIVASVGSASAAPLVPPTMPESDSVFQSMVDMFGNAGTIGLVIIGGAVALGLIVIIAMWAWRMLKKWLSASK